jgi:hypothetical protein
MDSGGGGAFPWSIPSTTAGAPNASPGVYRDDAGGMNRNSDDLREDILFHSSTFDLSPC